MIDLFEHVWGKRSDRLIHSSEAVGVNSGLWWSSREQESQPQLLDDNNEEKLHQGCVMAQSTHFVFFLHTSV